MPDSNLYMHIWKKWKFAPKAQVKYSCSLKRKLLKLKKKHKPRWKQLIVSMFFKRTFSTFDRYWYQHKTVQISLSVVSQRVMLCNHGVFFCMNWCISQWLLIFVELWKEDGYLWHLKQTVSCSSCLRTSYYTLLHTTDLLIHISVPPDVFAATTIIHACDEIILSSHQSRLWVCQQ